MSPLLLVLPVFAGPLPPLAAVTVPAPLHGSVVAGDTELSPRSTATAGLFKGRTEHIDQLLSWEPADGALLDAVVHERSLVYRALEQPAPADAPAPTSAEVAGQPALSWSVDAGSTLFFGTSLVCPDGPRVELTTYGTAGQPVEAVHRASLQTLACGAAPPQAD